MLFTGLLCVPSAGIMTTINYAKPKGANSLFIFIQSYQQLKAFVEHSQCRIRQILPVTLARCCVGKGAFIVKHLGEYDRPDISDTQSSVLEGLSMDAPSQKH
jgi:hypothetical protein